MLFLVRRGNVVMTITVLSDKIVSNEIEKKIKSIFTQSQCPNESLINSIPEFNHLDGNTIYLGNGSGTYLSIIDLEG